MSCERQTPPAPPPKFRVQDVRSFIDDKYHAIDTLLALRRGGARLSHRLTISQAVAMGCPTDHLDEIAAGMARTAPEARTRLCLWLADIAIHTAVRLPWLPEHRAIISEAIEAARAYARGQIGVVELQDRHDGVDGLWLSCRWKYDDGKHAPPWVEHASEAVAWRTSLSCTSDNGYGPPDLHEAVVKVPSCCFHALEELFGREEARLEYRWQEDRLIQWFSETPPADIAFPAVVPED